MSLRSKTDKSQLLDDGAIQTKLMQGASSESHAGEN